MSRRVLGLDLGQTSDPSALAGVEQVGQRYTVGHLERLPLGTSYPDIMERVVWLLAQPPLAGAALVIDGTGVGRPVVDMFTRKLGRQGQGGRCVPVSITAGQASSRAPDGYWHVPKRDLVSAIQWPLQAGQLKYAAGLPEVPILVRELLNFRMKITVAANDTYGTWREGQHDDLVLALGLAVWWLRVGSVRPLAGVGLLSGRAREPATRDIAHTLKVRG